MIDQTMAWAQSVCVESCVVEFLVRYSILRLEFPMPTYEVGYMIFSQISFYDNQYPFFNRSNYSFALHFDWLIHFFSEFVNYFLASVGGCLPVLPI